MFKNKFLPSRQFATIQYKDHLLMLCREMMVMYMRIFNPPVYVLLANCVVFYVKLGGVYVVTSIVINTVEI
jgi:hypothetical protein